MSAPETRADMLRRVLAENGVLKQAPDGIHSWRCEYPSRYGPCSCRDDLVADIESELDARDTALRALIAKWRERTVTVMPSTLTAADTERLTWAAAADELERAMDALPFEVGA